MTNKKFGEDKYDLTDENFLQCELEVLKFSGIPIE